MSAVELPFVEAAPLMSIAFANGTEDIPGVALAFLCLDRANVLEASAALRDLWAHNLTPGLMEGYDPIVLSEETMLRVVANATINGDHCMPHARLRGFAAFGCARRRRGAAQAKPTRSRDPDNAVEQPGTRMD
jgi:hypothetical protein